MKKKEKRLEKIHSISCVIEEVSKKYFDGDVSQGFVLWGADLYLTQFGLSNDEIIENMPGPGDIGIDFFYIDDENFTIYIFQFKFSEEPKTIPKEVISDLIETPHKLCNFELLRKCSNSKIIDFSDQFRTSISTKKYLIELVLVTTYTKTVTSEAIANDWNRRTLELDIPGERVTLNHELVICDLDEICTRYNSLRDQSEVNVEVYIEGSHNIIHSDIQCISITFPALELVRIFREKRFSIFRSNPRGPLGNVKVNNKMLNTLSDDIEKKYFHLYNNGLSCVCSSYELIDGNSLRINDFQIVNGCQTTYTLFEFNRRGGDLNGVLVNMKLIESQGQFFTRNISIFSNLQSPMKDWDFLFNNDDQIKLQRDFKNISPSYFYELKRGEYKYIEGLPDMSKITPKDIAQCAWAFIGHPGEAKDKVREIPQSVDDPSGVYHDVFFDNVSASVLRLPWEIFQRIREKHKQYLRDGNPKGDFFEHGRFHLLWLIGRSVFIEYKIKSFIALDPKLATSLYSNIDEWFEKHFDIAFKAIQDRKEFVEELCKEQDKTFSIRQLFRSEIYYEGFIKSHDRYLHN